MRDIVTILMSQSRQLNKAVVQVAKQNASSATDLAQSLSSLATSVQHIAVSLKDNLTIPNETLIAVTGQVEKLRLVMAPVLGEDATEDILDPFHYMCQELNEEARTRNLTALYQFGGTVEALAVIAQAKG